MEDASLKRPQVVIVGAGLGSIQGTSNVTFNGTIGAPQSWSDTRIVVGVPEAATTGLVVAGGPDHQKQERVPLPF